MNPRIAEAIADVEGQCECMHFPGCKKKLHALARNLARVVVEEAAALIEGHRVSYHPVGEPHYRVHPNERPLAEPDVNQVAYAAAIRTLLGGEAERGE